LHKDWIIHCAQSGKHILCEKPFVLTHAEAIEAISIVQKENVFCMEALMYRYHPFTKKLQELIQSQILGEIKLYHATYTANIAEEANPTAGGSIRNLGCYPVSLIRLLANAEPIDIQAIGRLNTINQNDNQASAILKFENNAMAVVSTADDIEMCWEFDVYGTKGNLKILTNPWLPDDSNKCLIYLNDQPNPNEISVTADKSLYTYQIDTMNQCIINKNYTAHDGLSLQDSLGNVAVLEKWQQQLKDSAEPRHCEPAFFAGVAIQYWIAFVIKSTPRNDGALQ
jgi:predicted dehydrogenase